jgi:predicted nucleic acid-binding protein
LALILDTGILYAAADADDAWHQRAARLLRDERGLRIVPVTVIPETCYLLNQRLGPAAERAFVDELGHRLPVEPLLDADLPLVRELLAARPDLGFVDASIAAVALRLRTTRVATTDRGHFSTLRLPSGMRLELLP